jgi:hypothetical protein
VSHFYSKWQVSVLIRLDLPEEVEGAPCHVQLIGRRQKDEALVQHARIVEEVLRK